MERKRDVESFTTGSVETTKLDCRQCVDCHCRSPMTETGYTLISSRYGWRLTKTVNAAGKRAMEWRCPKCWSNYRPRAKL